MSGNTGNGAGDALHLRDIFVRNIDDKIDGVIKASDDSNLVDEVNEYVLTNELQTNLERFLDAYNAPSIDYTNGVWISGFFGSGKSHLLKMLSHILGEAPAAFRTNGSGPLSREQVVDIMKSKARDAENHELEGMLDVNLRIPATSLLFNIDSMAQKGSRTALVDAFIRVFDEARGYYGANKYVAKMERDLDAEGLLGEFERQFELIAGKPWAKGRSQAAFSGVKIDRAFAATTGDEVQGILKDYQKQYNPTIADFADDVAGWLQKQPAGYRLVFLVDEVGQFVGKDADQMLNLQTVTEELFSRTHGRVWVIVTSQEDIDAIIGERSVRQGLDFTKIKGRFAINLKLSSTDVTEVIQKRLLAKNERGEHAVEMLWNRHRDELDALFAFQSDGGMRPYNHGTRFGSEADFSATYPFVSYEFDLFQDAMRGMSDAGFFDGQHRSVGERSLLATVSSALVGCKVETVGGLVPFCALYDGIAGAIQSVVNHRIYEANNELEGYEYKSRALALLKALLMVKHVRGFKANVRNLRILVLDGFDRNIPELEQNIRTTLDDLERRNYVRRTGDEYVYLTNDEQAIENEIKNVDVEDSQIRDRLGRIIRDDVLRSPYVEYGQGRNKVRRQYGLIIDNVTQGMSKPIMLHVITPMDGSNLEDKMLRSSGLREELRLVLGGDGATLLHDVAMVERTERYLRLHGNEQGPRGDIIQSKNHDKDLMLVQLRDEVNRALCSATVVYNGATLEKSASQDAISVVTEAMQTLIGRLYTNYGMVDGLAYTEKDLPGVLVAAEGNARTLKDTDAAPDRLDQPANDVYDYVAGQVGKKLVPTVRDIAVHYEDVPYGWPLADTLACLCHLYGAERIRLVLDSVRVPRTEVVKLLTNQRKRESIRVEIPKHYNAGKLRELREFANEYLGLTADRLPADPENMAQTIKDGLLKEVHGLENLKAADGRFVFVNQLDEPLERLRTVAGRPVEWLLETFPSAGEANNAEQLLDDKDNVIDLIRRVLNGTQHGILVDGLEWIRSNDSNFTLAPAELQGERDEALAAVNDPLLFRGNKVNLFKTKLMALQQHLAELVGAERRSSLDAVDAVRESITGLDSYREAPEDAQRHAMRALDEAEAKIGDAKYIADIRQTADTVRDRLYLELVNRLDAAKARTTEPSEPASGQVPEPAPTSAGEEPVIRTVRVAPPHPKPMLLTEADVDDFLDAYRRELMDAIRQGKRILL